MFFFAIIHAETLMTYVVVSSELIFFNLINNVFKIYTHLRIHFSTIQSILVSQKISVYDLMHVPS